MSLRDATDVLSCRVRRTPHWRSDPPALPGFAREQIARYTISAYIHKGVEMAEFVRAHRVLVDWISFTFPVEGYIWDKVTGHAAGLDRALQNYLGDTWSIMRETMGQWEQSGGRAPYAASYRSDVGMTLYYHPALDNALVEISGRGCDWLRTVGLERPVLHRARERVTRADLAVDIETATMPTEFASFAVSERFKALGIQQSDTGETCYIGSRKSERYCRVYRYFKPHPRSQYLRIEFVHRKRNARMFVNQAINSGYDWRGLANGGGEVYGFSHEDWNLSGDVIPLQSWTPERHAGKTVSWLVSQVAPAFRRLVRDGVIDNPEAFVSEHFL